MIDAKTRPHTHYCPHCDRDVACFVAQRGERCMFSSTSGMTCNDCAARQHPLPGELEDEPSRKPQDTSQRRFLPAAVAPSGPLEPAE